MDSQTLRRSHLRLTVQVVTTVNLSVFRCHPSGSGPGISTWPMAIRGPSSLVSLASGHDEQRDGRQGPPPRHRLDRVRAHLPRVSERDANRRALPLGDLSARHIGDANRLTCHSFLLRQLARQQAGADRITATSTVRNGVSRSPCAVRSSPTHSSSLVRGAHCGRNLSVRKPGASRRSAARCFLKGAYGCARAGQSPEWVSARCDLGQSWTGAARPGPARARHPVNRRRR